jgi:hypothetical protein
VDSEGAVLVPAKGGILGWTIAARTLRVSVEYLQRCQAVAALPCNHQRGSVITFTRQPRSGGGLDVHRNE